MTRTKSCIHLLMYFTKYPSCVQKSLTTIPNGDRRKNRPAQQQSHHIVFTGQLEIFSWQEAAKLRVVLRKVQKPWFEKLFLEKRIMQLAPLGAECIQPQKVPSVPTKMKRMAILQWTHQDPISPWCDFRWVRPIRSPVVYAPRGVGLSTELGRMTTFLGASTTTGVNFRINMKTKQFQATSSPTWTLDDEFLGLSLISTLPKLITRRNENEWILMIHLTTLVLIGPECQNQHLGDFPSTMWCHHPNRLPPPWANPLQIGVESQSWLRCGCTSKHNESKGLEHTPWWLWCR